MERGAVAVVVVFLCLRFPPEVGADPLRGDAALEPTDVDDDGTGLNKKQSKFFMYIFRLNALNQVVYHF